MDIHTIENEFLKLVVSEDGAEMQSVKDKKGVEYLWQGDKNIWGRKAPVLFPIVGRLYEDTYLYDNKSFKMTQHGFARDKRFDLLLSGDDSLTFLLTEDEHTLEIYPFNFNLYISYQLIQNAIRVTYEVQNTGEKPMYFSIGGHPGFNCPMNSDEAYENYELEFENEEFCIYPLSGNFQSGEKSILKLNSKALKLSPKLFEMDALIFKNGDLSTVTLKHQVKKSPRILFKTDMPFFGIWSPKGKDKFICLEPWHGVADYAKTTELKQKEGIIVLGNEEIHRSNFEFKIIN